MSRRSISRRALSSLDPRRTSNLRMTRAIHGWLPVSKRVRVVPSQDYGGIDS